MDRIAPKRVAVACLFLACGAALAQSPATPVATQGGSIADVVYAQGQLQITADNSSLNQILRGISRQTGMKITGGVLDERVYGKYGPAPPAQVLSILLAGTGTNMLLKETPSGTPVELVLAPRQGGPTPPSPAPSATDTTPAPPVLISTSPVGVRGQQQGTGRTTFGPADGINPDAASDGFQTQQQVAEHLEKIQQAQRQLAQKPR